VASVDELQDIDYRQDTHLRPVRHHFGITAFGTNAWTAANMGDRLMPEHEEDEGSEELYIVLRGHARFEIDGNTVDAPQGTLVFVQPLVNRTAYAEEPQTVVLAVGSTVGKPYEAVAGRSGPSSIRPTKPATTSAWLNGGEAPSKRAATRHRFTTLLVARRSLVRPRRRSNTYALRSSGGPAFARSLWKTVTSIPFGTSARSPNSSANERG
jgi:mannose-6-phosphate isomerase-like protein (cupin superfamily)